MTDEQLEKFCENNPYCGCNCTKCSAFAANYRYNNGDDIADEDEYDENYYE